MGWGKQCYAHAFVILASSSACLIHIEGAKELLSDAIDVYDRWFWHALAVMALPAIASQLIALVYNIADTWFVGRTNDPYMVAACSLVLPVHRIIHHLSKDPEAGRMATTDMSTSKAKCECDSFVGKLRPGDAKIYELVANRQFDVKAELK